MKRQPSSLEHNEPDNLANERDELSSQKDDAILPSLSSHSNDSMNKNEEERDEAIDEQTDHLNQEQTSSETGSKTILTGPIPKPPQDVEVRQYWFKNWHKINVSKLHYSYWFIQIANFTVPHIHWFFALSAMEQHFW